jgi:hypothetical protein
MPNRERVEAFIASVVCGVHIRAIADYCGGEIRLRRCVGMGDRRDSLAGTRDARGGRNTDPLQGERHGEIESRDTRWQSA